MLQRAICAHGAGTECSDLFAFRFLMFNLTGSGVRSDCLWSSVLMVMTNLRLVMQVSCQGVVMLGFGYQGYCLALQMPGL